jgi:hypothetical protein
MRRERSFDRRAFWSSGTTTSRLCFGVRSQPRVQKNRREGGKSAPRDALFAWGGAAGCGSFRSPAVATPIEVFCLSSSETHNMRAVLNVR